MPLNELEADSFADNARLQESDFPKLINEESDVLKENIHSSF